MNFSCVVDQSAARAQHELATHTGAAQSEGKTVVVVHTETPDAAHAIRELFAVNGISFMAESHADGRKSFEVNSALYRDAKKAILANIGVLRARAPIADFCFYFSTRSAV